MISLTVDQYARRAAMQMLLDAGNLACCLQGSFFLKLSGWTHASNSWYQTDTGHSDDVHCTGDFLNRQQFGPHIQDQYQACHQSCSVSLGEKTWISRCCLLHNRNIRTVDKVKCPRLFFQISVLLRLLLTTGASDTSVPVSARVQNYTTDLFSFSSLKGPRW